MKSTKKLKVRLVLSFLTFFTLLGGAFAVFRYVQEGEQLGRTPKLLRHSFMWNEDVARLLRSNKRMSVNKPKPTKGKPPRVNGMLGLETPLKLKDYRVVVQDSAHNLSLKIADFKLLPKTAHSTDFRCIEGWSEELHYAGTKFSDFMKEHKVGIKNDGSYYNYVGLETPDKQYYVSIDMESMLHDQTLLVWEMNEAPISVENGAPIRLIIPIKYGIKSLKRIGRIFFSDTRPPDYWAERGYDWYSGL